ncbi:MAG TPA: phosphate/phosphite/phosphonate ABC transporter substrate-binding protein [Puia sp.]|jgi:phosphonate transport system substrate-binding protein|nr:phosphate/phosphite/phosphonate ABC transporter substrate-binding protein [Puia sp.]
MGLSGVSLSVCLFYLAICPMTACSGKRQQGYTPRFEAEARSGKVLTLGVPGKSLYETADLLVRYLNDHLDSVKIQTVACSGMDDYQEKLRNGYFDLTVINGPQLLGAEHNGYRAVGQISDASKAVILVHKDSGIHRFSDIRGQTISLAGKNSLSGAMMPLMFLYRQGIDVNGALRRIYAPSNEAAILNVYLGHSSMGAAWKPAWEIYLRQRPEIGSKVEARWETPPLVNAGILLRMSIDSTLGTKISRLFFQMNADEEGRRALQRLNISGFEPADSSSFRPMEAFLREYNAVIH